MNAKQSTVKMGVATCNSARMLACDSMRYASGNVILVSKLMSTTVRLLRVPSALVIYITKHGYVNGIVPLQSICPWQ